MRLWSVLTVLCVALFLVACGAKPHLLQKDIGYSDFIKNVQTANPYVFCSYKGRIAVSFQSLDGGGSFSGNINKYCNEDISLTVFGPLNSIFAQIEYKGGNTSVKTSDKKSEANIRAFAQAAFDGFISFLRYPLYMPDENGTIGIKGNLYIYDGGYEENNVIIFFDKDFRIVKYTIGGDEPYNIDYILMEDGKPSTITINKGGQGVSMKLLNVHGWSGPDE